MVRFENDDNEEAVERFLGELKGRSCRIYLEVSDLMILIETIEWLVNPLGFGLIYSTNH